MRKKQAITKDEAIILLQSQPLSASLWQLASDRLKDNAIRFPDPSYLDSQSWPDYMPRKKKNGIKKSIETETSAIQEILPIQQNKNIESELINNESEKTATEYFQIEETQEIITIEVIESQIENIPEKKTKLPAKRKSKKVTTEIQENIESIDVNNDVQNPKAEIHKPSAFTSESLDFYEWLEELKETDQQEESQEARTKKQKATKQRAKISKAAKELADAKTQAENSLTLGEEIVSETLARLLARQGHKEEAIEMYEKLILKYPEKGATFAAALQKLKS